MICNDCGHCCSLGGRCELREWVGLTPGFMGRCEQLITQEGKATRCAVMLNEPAEVLDLIVDGTCEFPLLRIDG